ncbi:MAG TPA: gliding motility-associated C-terminal domain-containing protein, partial [Cytophagaceae bacterium]
MLSRTLSGIITALLFISLGKLNAQSYTCFTLDKYKGCVPLTVKASYCGVYTGYTEYNFEYSGSDNFDLDSVHTYTQPGVYTVKLFNHNGAIPFFSDTTVIVLPRTKPHFTVHKLSDGIVKVEITDTNYDSFVIDYGDGHSSPTITNGSIDIHQYSSTAPVTIKVSAVYSDLNCGNDSSITINPLPLITTAVINNTSVLSVSPILGRVQINFTPQEYVPYKLIQKTFDGTYKTVDTFVFNSNLPQNIVADTLDTENTSYCFRVVPFDAEVDFPASNELCSQTIHAEALNNQNRVTWKNLGAASYSLTIDSNTPITGLTGNEYIDNNIKCGQEYSYTITAHFPGGLYSSSGAIAVKGTSTIKPSAIEELNSTIEGEKVKLTWDPPLQFPVNHYIISSSENASAYSEGLNYSGVSPYIDINSNPNNNTYCYKIRYVDICSNLSDDSISTCPVFLQASKNDNSVDLSWTDYIGSWNSGIGNYEIEVLDRSDAVVETINSSLFTLHSYAIAFGTSSLRFRIKTKSGSGNEVSYSNTVEVTFEPEIYIPTVFTPNGDGTNDVFRIKGKYFKDFKLTIFNRWGEVIFYTDKLDTGWDGIVDGTPAPADAYA